MRPVLLEMDGFASFRQRTVVDFREVDYFALVGPTGAGKSTVIDAITFALYGSVARWDDAKAVAPALAPTVNRGTVKLVFDSQGQRYVAMREVRRAASGSVTVKTARLERLDDPQSLGGPDDASTVLGDASQTKVEVERLLGLDFNQFTKCVALPQGDFAEFLHATGRDRDKILTKLLGIDGYVRLGQRANSRASYFTTQAETFRASFDASFDVSDEALAAAEAMQARLATLQDSVAPALTTLRELAQQTDQATRRLAVLTEEDTALAGIQVPAGLADLDQRTTSASTAATIAAAAIKAAEELAQRRRTAVTEHAPRAELELLVLQHQESAQLNGQLPTLSSAATASASALETVCTERSAADNEHARAAAAATHAEQQQAAAATDLAVKEHELALLDGVRAPEDLAELTAGQQDLTAGVVAAEAALDSARASLTAARRTRDTLPQQRALERAAGALDLLAGTCAKVSTAAAQLPALRAAAESAADAAKEAEQEAAKFGVHAAALADQRVAAELRSHLHEGATCPVCDQDVAVVPAAIDQSAFADGEAALRAAQERAAELNRDRLRQESALTTGSEALSTLKHQIAQEHATVDSALTATGLSALPDIGPVTEDDTVAQVVNSVAVARTALEDASTQEARAAQEVQSAETEIERAESEHRRAQEAVRAAAGAQQTARSQLRAARDPLVPLGAPALDDTELAGAWTRLQDWATSQRQAASTALPPLQDAAASAASDVNRTQEDLAIATAQRASTQTAYDLAVTAASEAKAAVTQAKERLDRLAASLVGCLPLPDVEQALIVLDGLERAAAEADIAVTQAREERDAADVVLAEVANDRRQAHTELVAARDPLVALGAPPLPEGQPFADAWEGLFAWAAQQRQARSDERGGLAERAASLAQDYAEAADRLLALTAAEGVSAPAGVEQDLAEWVPARVATAVAESAAAVATIAEARARAAELQAKAAAANEQAQVARALGNLLSIDKFPRWITRSALEVLVTAASATLMELSVGQFELTLSGGGSFTVIDHNDADAERIVKTLSGGETFQASLALALALSTHLGTLAAEGAAQLEAIFIDEGFGTLDEQTLDVVAGTLETLATSAGRMVGVITHVPGLAARVPVRFAVNRDRRGSTVVKTDG